VCSLRVFHGYYLFNQHRWPDTYPRAPCFPPRFTVFVNAENEDKVKKMVANLFNQSFEITSSLYLANFAKTIFAPLLQHHDEMQRCYGMDHIIVRNVIVSAQKFGITMTELAEWGNLVRDDFIMRNAARNPSGVFNMEYLVHFNTVSMFYTHSYCILKRYQRSVKSSLY
jgi:hypothetical protein